jgi:hypothetical protein
VYSARSSVGPPWRRSWDGASLSAGALGRTAVWLSRPRRGHLTLLSLCLDLTNITVYNALGRNSFLD